MTAPSTPNLSRRGFLRGSTAAGIAVKVSFLRGTAQARLADGAPRPGPGWIVGGKPRHRLDALAKVTGAKTFTRDYRARASYQRRLDLTRFWMTGWVWGDSVFSADWREGPDDPCDHATGSER